MAEHAPLSFSASERWINCPASYQEGLRVPPFKGNEYTRAGTAAHLLGEQTTRDSIQSKEAKPALEAVQAMEIPPELQGEEQEEHLAAVAHYVDYLVGLRHEGYELHLEQRVQFGPDALELFGTADCIAVNKEKGELRVIDYKHGRGHSVAAEHNAQLLSYLAAVLDSGTLDLAGVHRYFIEIVQPRARSEHGIASYEVPFEEAWDHMQAMIEARKQARGQHPSYKMGGWCRWCPALAYCGEVRSHVEEGLKLDEYSREDLLKGLEIVELAEHWCERVRGVGHEYLEQGGDIPGWALYPKRAIRKWVDASDACNALLNSGLAREAIFEERLLSPAKVQKMMDRDAWQQIEDAVVVAQSSGTTLAREDPSREELGGQAARIAKAAARVQAMDLLKPVGNS
jgi:RecB family exonuclease